jgi:hypothetical protein
MMRTDDDLAAELAPPKRDEPICSQKLQVSLLPPFRRPEWPAKTTLVRSAFLCAASPAACIPVLRRCAAAPSAVPNRRTTRFLIDTPAIRIQLNPLKTKHYIFSNRHSPQGLKLHTIRALRAPFSVSNQESARYNGDPRFQRRGSGCWTTSIVIPAAPSHAKRSDQRTLARRRAAARRRESTALSWIEGHRACAEPSALPPLSPLPHPPLRRRALISSAVAPRIVARRMIVVLHKRDFFEPSEPRWASPFMGAPLLADDAAAARRRND